MSLLLSYAGRHHVALLALLLVLTGGTAYAAHQLPKNSVTSKQIKNGSVKGADLRAGAVTGTQVADGSLTAADLAAGTIPSPTPGQAIPPFGEAHGTTLTSTSSLTATPIAGMTVQVTMAKAGTLVVEWTALTSCLNTAGFKTTCQLNLTVDGVRMDGEDPADTDRLNESTPTGADVAATRTVVRTASVSAGLHTVTVNGYTSVLGGLGSFTMNDWNLVVTGHYSS